MLSIAQQIEAAMVNRAGEYCPPDIKMAFARNTAKQNRDEILAVLRTEGAMTCRQIADKFEISSTTASKYVNTLINHGLISRVDVPGSTKRHFAAKTS